MGAAKLLLRAQEGTVYPVNVDLCFPIKGRVCVYVWRRCVQM